MTDVARRRQRADRFHSGGADARNATTSRSFPSRRSRHSTGHRSASVRYESESDTSQPGYVMQVVAQPPANATAHRPFERDVQVQLLSMCHHVDGDHGVDLSHLVAVATIVPGSGHESESAIAPHTLTGRVFDSIHPIAPSLNDYRQHERSGRRIGYLSFSNLAVAREGVFRIRISLIRVGGFAGNGGEDSPGGATLLAVDSDPVTVRRDSWRAPDPMRY